MSDVYRLVFRGEVLEGQHPAVVRKRLASAADFDEAALDKLFSGKPVVLKREADTATAARLQVMFKKAGARLRVLPVEGQETPALEPASPPAAGGSDSPGGAPTGPSGARQAFVLLPAGSDLLRQEERVPWAPREVDTSRLELAKTTLYPRDGKASPIGPEVPQLTVAEAGARLGPAREQPDDAVQAPDYELADAGADLGPEPPAPPAPAMGELAFQVAPVGTTLDQRPAPAAPAAPETSHLKLANEEH